MRDSLPRNRGGVPWQHGGQPEQASPFRWYHVVLPVGLSVGVLVYLFWHHEFDWSLLKEFRLSGVGWFWLGMAVLALIVRHGLLMLRLRMLAGATLTWGALFQIVTLWEFGMLLAPMVVGGTAASVILFLREGFSAGRTASLVMTIIFLDHLIFVVLGPVLYWWIPDVFPAGFGGASLEVAFWLGWLVFAVYCLLLGYGIWYRPRSIARLLYGLSRLPGLRRWAKGFRKTARDIYWTALHLRDKGWWFWLEIGILTLGVWSFRFLNASLLVQALVPETGLWDHIVMYGRQTVMWLVLLVMPTPGGAGAAELGFAHLFEEFLPEGWAPLLTLLWRVLSGYIYLVVGAVVLPFWWRRTQLRRKMHTP